MVNTGQWAVGPESIRMLELGHPWIIADSHTKKWPTGRAGELVELTDGQGRFLATALLDPGKRVVARVLARERIHLDKAWLSKQIQKAIDMRRLHAGLVDTDAFRLVNGEGDGLPGLTIDCYGGYLLLQLYSEGWRPYLDCLKDTLRELLQPSGIYEKSRPQITRDLESVSESKKYGRCLHGTPLSNKLEVRENGLNFLVDLERGLHTGLFLDQRKNRRDLMSRAAGKRVLNLFAFTAAFSVAAAASAA
jgi:23S rRNA (cytosine1962-C5)-methyltransferase